jgi:hypothetical protein
LGLAVVNDAYASLDATRMIGNGFVKRNLRTPPPASATPPPTPKPGLTRNALGANLKGQVSKSRRFSVLVSLDNELHAQIIIRL